MNEDGGKKGFLSSDEPSKYIEEAIDRQESLLTVLRLFCLQSLTLGIKASRFEQLKREILQVIKETPFFRKKENAQTCLFFKKKKKKSYGFEHIVTLQYLEKLGYLKKDSKTNYGILKKSLQLFTEDFDEKNPNDIAYVHAGYSPISIRLVQQAFKPGFFFFLKMFFFFLFNFFVDKKKKGGWKGKEELFRLIPGPTIEEIQTSNSPQQQQSPTSRQNNTPVTLVFFIGISNQFSF